MCGLLRHRSMLLTNPLGHARQEAGSLHCVVGRRCCVDWLGGCKVRNVAAAIKDGTAVFSLTRWKQCDPLLALKRLPKKGVTSCGNLSRNKAPLGLAGGDQRSAVDVDILHVANTQKSTYPEHAHATCFNGTTHACFLHVMQHRVHTLRTHSVKVRPGPAPCPGHAWSMR
jgi:hypothetical protein